MKSEENEKIVKILTILRNMQDVMQNICFSEKEPCIFTANIL